MDLFTGFHNKPLASDCCLDSILMRANYADRVFPDPPSYSLALFRRFGELDVPAYKILTPFVIPVDKPESTGCSL